MTHISEAAGIAPCEQLYPVPDFGQIEEAIKLLQGAGYEVFKKSAGITLSAVTTCNTRIARRHDSYLSRVRDEAAHRIAVELLRSELLEFRKEPLLGDQPYMMDERFHYIGELKAFPSTRKEWRR